MASWDSLTRAELEKQVEMLSCFTGMIHGKPIRFEEFREARSTKLRDQKPVTCAETHLPLVSGHRAE